MSTDEYDDPLGVLRNLTGDSTLAMAALGAVVSVFGSFLPVSPLFGGMLAGYLTRGSRREGVRVGAISGVIAAIPILLFFGLFFGFGTFGFAMEVPRAGALFLLIAVFALGATLVFTIGLSAGGGWLGVFLFDEYVRDREAGNTGRGLDGPRAGTERHDGRSGDGSDPSRGEGPDEGGEGAEEGDDATGRRDAEDRN